MSSANPTVSTAFITQYEADVHHSFQRTGSKLLNAVMLVRGATGSTVDFPTLGAVTAVQKARHADLTPVNPSHAKQTATMADWYVPIYSDTLDELKSNIDYRRNYARAGAAAIGRKADEIVTDELQNATNTVQEGGTVGLSLAKIRSATETLDANDVPNDGNRWALIGAHQWQELLNIDAFARADYVGDSLDLPFASGVRVKQWYGYNWMMFSGLPLVDAGANRACFFFHRDAVGMGINEDIRVRISFVAEKESWLITHRMSMGCTIIDNAGLVLVECDDDATIV